MATLRNKKKLLAVSRETPESTRSGRTQNILDPELTQDFISQVSEEIEGRVTKKLSKEFSRTESRILGALSKLDEFLLNPQVRTCSVAVPGTSRNSNLENQGTNEDRSSDDPGPEVEFSSPRSGVETVPQMMTGATDPHTNCYFIDRKSTKINIRNPTFFNWVHHGDCKLNQLLPEKREKFSKKWNKLVIFFPNFNYLWFFLHKLTVAVKRFPERPSADKKVLNLHQPETVLA